MRAIHEMPITDLYDAIADANNNDESYAVTVIRGSGAGEKALIQGGRMTWNSDPGGFLKAREAALADLGEGGVIHIDGRDIFVELLGNEKDVVVCGAGHLSLPVITITRMMGMHVTVIDDREEFTENARRHGANRVICKPFREAMKDIEGSDDTFFVIVTRGHRYDSDCVEAALLKKHAYVGMIGSKRHAVFVREALLEHGIPEELIDTIYTPIGLDIGAETPEEIAVAIVGEIIRVKNRRRKNFGFPKEILRAVTDRDREPMILTTIVSKDGSAPRGAGSKMLVRRDGSIIGTIGGGIAEGMMIKHAAELLEKGFGGIELRHISLESSAEEDGMVCGGSIDVMLEAV